MMSFEKYQIQKILKVKNYLEFKA